MPLFDYRCKCGHESEHFAKPDETKLPCPKCKGKMERQFHSRYGISMGVGAYGYYDDNLGCHVRTNAHKREVMRKQGVTEKFGKGWM